MDDIQDVNVLKAQAAELLAKLRREIASGDLNLSPMVKSALVQDSASELDGVTDLVKLDAILKERGIPKPMRKKIIYNRRRELRKPNAPAHTIRANKAAQKQALKIHVAKAQKVGLVRPS